MTRLAILGAGRIATVHAQAIAVSSANLSTIYDVDAGAAAALARRHAARVAPAMDDILGDPAIDGVVICTPTDTHIDYMLAAARAGKAVLCEKPVSLDLQSAVDCAASVAASGVTVQIGFNRRFDPTHAALADGVRAGRIGRLENLLIVSRDPAPPPSEYVARSGGLFMDMTIHDFDMARFILGEEPVELCAFGTVQVDAGIGQQGDIDSASVILRTASGAQCQIINSRRAVYGYDQRIEAFGETGMLCSGNPRATALTHWSSASTAARAPLMNFFLERYAESFGREIASFVQCIEQQKQPAVSLDDGIAAMKLAQSALRSVHTGQSVAL